MVWAVPREDATTLGEVDGELFDLSTRDDQKFMTGDYVRRGGRVFPLARVTGLKPMKHARAFADDEEAWATATQREAQARRLVKQVANGVGMFFLDDEQHVVRVVVEKTQQALHALKVQIIGPEAEEDSAFVPPSRRRDATESIVAIAWHPTMTLLAIAQRDGVVSFYDPSASAWDRRVLDEPRQMEITDIAWARFSKGTIAVACRGGILLWKMDCSNSQKEPELIQVLTHRTKTTIDQISWNEDGSLLAGFSKDTRTVCVWDVTFERYTELSCGDVVTGLHWSPTGEYLFVTTASGIPVLWEACTWTKETWNVKTNLCAWSSNGRCLLVSPRNSSLLYPYEFKCTPPLFDVGINTPPIDMNEKEIKSLDGSTAAFVGGQIRSMAWDPTGSRVAITYTPLTTSGGDDIAPLIAILSVTSKPFLVFTPSGLVRGPPHSGVPRKIAFASRFPHGALLSVAWSSGVVSFYPFYFEAS